MKKIKLLVSAFAVALVAMLALAPAAQAQDAPIALADPPFVEAAGSYEFNLTGTGWIAGAVVAVPCPGITSYEQLVTEGAAGCDATQLNIGAADGTNERWSAQMTFNCAGHNMGMPFMEYHVFCKDAAGNHVMHRGVIAYQNWKTIEGIRIYPSTGTIDNGTYELYGF